MNAIIAELLSEVKALRQSVDALRSKQQADSACAEITTREALKIMRCNTNASLSSLVKLFPSIKIRRGIYDKNKLIAALSARTQLKRLNSGGVYQ